MSFIKLSRTEMERLLELAKFQYECNERFINPMINEASKTDAISRYLYKLIAEVSIARFLKIDIRGLVQSFEAKEFHYIRKQIQGQTKVEIKFSNRKDHMLMLNELDLLYSANTPYIYAVATCNFLTGTAECRIYGWSTPQEVVQEKFRTREGKTYAMPNYYLHELDALPFLIKERVS